MKLFRGLGVLALVITGCASNPPPKGLGATEAAVGGAEQVGGQGDPQAALYLKLAHEELAQAKRLAEQGEGQRADRMLLRSLADAELSLALARQSMEQNQAQEAINEVRLLRSKANSDN